MFQMGTWKLNYRNILFIIIIQIIDKGWVVVSGG